MTTADFERTEVDTLISGVVIIERSEGKVRTYLESDAGTAVTIEREGPRTDKRSPIGSRHSSALTMRLNDRELGLTVGSGRVLKRTYRVVVEIDGRVVSLRPKDIETHTFLNGKPHEIEKEFGELTARADGTIEVFWALPKKVLHKTIEPPVPTTEDLLIGYAAAAAFGTGALSLTTILMGAVASIMPG
ncbi:hypothetical protein [Nocardia wallacei]|uniref:hypothetical protein n=1 Tax=Nocardia wallacei TaxID=480035 RepID=UPI00245402BE|nr:hypothetical protein [Nocardia wallacei]